MIASLIEALMKNRKTVICKAALALLFALSLTACGEDSPETMLASAKDYLSKNDVKAATIQLKNALKTRPNLPEARFLLGKLLLQEGLVSAADVEFRKATELNYPADELIPLHAQVLLTLGQAQKVIDDFGRVRLSVPESSAELRTAIGDAYLTLGKVDAAKEAYEAALSFAPGYGPALFSQARIKGAGGDKSGALTLLDAALAKNPRLYDASRFKGDILASEGRIEEAMGIYRKVIELKPDYLPAYVSLIAREMQIGDVEEAEKQFEAMRKISPKSPQTAYIRAELLYQQKKFTEAREAVQMFLRMVPDSVPGQQLAGAIEFELKSYAGVERYLSSVLPKVPKTGIARRILIASYLRGGQPEKALGTLRPVLDEIDGDSNFLALAGEVFMQNGDVEKAGDYFVKAAALDPENKSKQTAVALSRLAKGQTETAYRELERIASTDSGIQADMALISSQMRSRKFDQALKSIDGLERKRADDPLISPLIDNLRGTALLGKRDVKGARANFESALRKSPDYFPAVANLARIDMAEKKPDEAKQRFRDVLARNPGSSFALLSLAELVARTGGKKEEVVALIDKAVAANPTDVAPHLALINFYLGARDLAKAVAAASTALSVLPDNPDVMDVAGRAQQAMGNHNQALSIYGKLSEQSPSAIRPYLRMAEVHLAAKDRDSAALSLRKALSIKPDSIEAQRAMIMLDLDAGRLSNAVATARNVQRQYPGNPAGYLLEGNSYAASKAWKEAEEAYRNGIRQTGSNELAMGVHAALLARNAPGEADRFSASWLKEHPKDHRFRLYLAESAAAHGDYPMAIRHYRTLLDSQPDNPAVLNNLAWVMAKNKDPKALDMAEKAYRMAPDQANITDTLGSLLVARGDFDRGLELLRKAHSLAPNNPMIQFNLADALIKSGKEIEAKPMLVELSTLGSGFSKSREVGELLRGIR
ncbi:MAG: PEP-CTERM system TPR-repeat protein PrsT [Candidatus Accumulibacter sp.]|nr:PEP-CTERM system TPR-repeat protein PrsT [Accumulibacter sp.]